MYRFNSSVGPLISLPAHFILSVSSPVKITTKIQDRWTLDNDLVRLTTALNIGREYFSSVKEEHKADIYREGRKNWPAP